MNQTHSLERPEHNLRISAVNVQKVIVVDEILCVNLKLYLRLFPVRYRPGNPANSAGGEANLESFLVYEVGIVANRLGTGKIDG